jgi:hypothetical protein
MAGAIGQDFQFAPLASIGYPGAMKAAGICLTALLLTAPCAMAQEADQITTFSETTPLSSNTELSRRLSCWSSVPKGSQSQKCPSDVLEGAGRRG